MAYLCTDPKAFFAWPTFSGMALAGRREEVADRPGATHHGPGVR
jgi:hypothetical protein